MISINAPRFVKTLAFFEKLNRFDPTKILHKYGELGVGALAAATPKDTGEASASWSYSLSGGPERYELVWTNSDMAGSTPLVLLIQYGHGTRGGTYVPPVDFINPAMKGLFTSLAAELALEVMP